MKRFIKNQAGSPTIERIIWIALFFTAMIACIIIYIVKGATPAAEKEGYILEKTNNDKFCALYAGQIWDEYGGEDGSGYDYMNRPACRPVETLDECNATTSKCTYETTYIYARREGVWGEWTTTYCDSSDDDCSERTAYSTVEWTYDHESTTRETCNDVGDQPGDTGCKETEVSRYRKSIGSWGEYVYGTGTCSSEQRTGYEHRTGSWTSLGWLDSITCGSSYALCESTGTRTVYSKSTRTSSTSGYSYKTSALALSACASSSYSNDCTSSSTTITGSGYTSATAAKSACQELGDNCATTVDYIDTYSGKIYTATYTAKTAAPTTSTCTSANSTYGCVTIYKYTCGTVNYSDLITIYSSSACAVSANNYASSSCCIYSNYYLYTKSTYGKYYVAWPSSYSSTSCSSSGTTYPWTYQKLVCTSTPVERYGYSGKSYRYTGYSDWSSYGSYSTSSCSASSTTRCKSKTQYNVRGGNWSDYADGSCNGASDCEERMTCSTRTWTQQAELFETCEEDTSLTSDGVLCTPVTTYQYYLGIRSQYASIPICSASTDSYCLSRQEYATRTWSEWSEYVYDYCIENSMMKKGEAPNDITTTCAEEEVYSFTVSP